MHEHHDPDLIAAYADGSYEGDPTEVESLLESCAECRAGLAVQRDILEMLRQATPVAMTDDERTRLRAGVHAALDMGAEVVPLERRPLNRVWLAVGSAAAAMLVMVGIAGNLGGTDTPLEAVEEMAALDGDGSFDTTASDLAGAALAAESPADASDEASVETTAAAATEQAVTRTFLYNAETATVDEFRRMLDEQAALIDPGAAKRLAPDDFSQAELPSPTCLDVPEGRVVSVTTGSIAGEPVEGFVVVDDATDALVTVIYSAGSCTLIE